MSVSYNSTMYKTNYLMKEQRLRKILLQNKFCIFMLVAPIVIIFVVVHVNKVHHTVSDFDTLTSIQNQLIESPVEPHGIKNIFFLETSQPEHRISILQPRQACSIEAAARHHPDWKVFFYILDVDTYEPDPLWTVVKSLVNVHVKHINAENYTKGTPGELVLEKVLATKEDWFAPHVSDLLRYVMLYLNAGVYLDLDMILLKPLDEIGLNFAGFEAEPKKIPKFGTAIFSFGNDWVGREAAGLVLEDFADNYSYNSFPQSLKPFMRSIEKICNTTDAKEMNLNKCNGFKVYPPRFFYPIPYSRNAHFFNEDHYEDIMEKLEDPYGVHIWNHLSVGKTASKDSNTALNEIAKRFCPRVFEVADRM